MFATPDWDDDSPSNTVKFAKQVKAIKTKTNKSDSAAKDLQKTAENEVQNNKKNKKTKVSKHQGYSVFQIPEAKGISHKVKQNTSSNNVGSKINLLENKNKVKPAANTKKIKAAKNSNKIVETDSKSVNKENKVLDNLMKIKKKEKPAPQQFITSPKLETQEHSKMNGHENDLQKISVNKTSPKKDKVNGEKRKLEPNVQPSKAKKKKLSKENDIDYSTDRPDELLLNMQNKKLTESLEIDTPEDLLFKERINPTKGKKGKNKTSKVVVPLTKTEKHKEHLKQILKMDEKSHRNPIRTKGAELRQKMLEKLKSAQFRYLNEKLYTSSGTEAQQLFQSDPQAFQTYHEGYQQQIKKWPVNPLDVIVKRISKLPKSSLIADMGCGEAKLAQRLSSYKVRSFDLVSTSPIVEACDMARTPLLTSSVDVAVYCLALMGTTLTQYLAEANRVLKTGGLLLIAEVESRFDDADAFAKEVQKLGFKLIKLDKSQNVFFFMEFKKMQECGKKQKAHLNLKPCYYKKR